jgi:hypothetical protein
MAGSAERTSPSQMQRCEVMYNFRISFIEDATNDKYGDGVGEKSEN